MMNTFQFIGLVGGAGAPEIAKEGNMNENELSHAVIGAAIEVHREVGPGIIEKAYEEAMCHELHLRGLPFARQRTLPFIYKGVRLSTDLRTDLMVDGKVILDLKAKDQVAAIDKLKVLTSFGS